MIWVLAIIIFGVLSLITLIIFICKRFIIPHRVKRLFNSLSLCVCGDRGSGKDTLFSYVARKIPHNSNCPLQPHTNLISLDELMIPNLNRRLLVDGYRFNVDFNDYKKFENMTFISDAGIHFPSYEDAKLKKEYDNLAISIAIWRHLYNAPLHFNCQRSSRLWLILREQINHIVDMHGVIWGIFYCKISFTYYENVKDYEDGKTAISKPLLMKEDSNIIVEKSNRGIIQDYEILIPKRYIKHNTHYFKEIVFKEENNG